MTEYTGEISKCDVMGWEVRKLYPEHYCCCRDGKCLARGENERREDNECVFRESCDYGTVCKGPSEVVCLLGGDAKRQDKDQVQEKKLTNPEKVAAKEQ